MNQWFWYAVGAAVLYGLHQVFTKLASSTISDGLGGFVVEGSAALTILVYLGWLWFSGHWDQKADAAGVGWSVVTGLCVGVGTFCFSCCSKKADRCPPCRWYWRRGYHGGGRCFVLQGTFELGAGGGHCPCHYRIVSAAEELVSRPSQPAFLPRGQKVVPLLHGRVIPHSEAVPAGAASMRVREQISGKHIRLLRLEPQ